MDVTASGAMKGKGEGAGISLDPAAGFGYIPRPDNSVQRLARAPGLLFARALSVAFP